MAIYAMRTESIAVSSPIVNFFHQLYLSGHSEFYNPWITKQTFLPCVCGACAETISLAA